MSYLSRRMREMKAEDAARKSGITTTFINTVKAGQITAGIDWAFPKAMAMVDLRIRELQDEAFALYEYTMAQRNPHLRESPINFRNRGA